VGKIFDVTYFSFEGRAIWRHWIETNQGVFELYSYPDGSDPYYEKRLSEYFETHRGQISPKLVHSFERHHKLVRMSAKQQISVKQAMTEFEALKTQSIVKAFRVYGSIIQIQFSKNAVLSSYGHWVLQKQTSAKTEILADSWTASKEKMDEEIIIFEKSQSTFQQAEIREDQLGLFFSENYILVFQKETTFPAMTLHIDGHQNWMSIFDEQKIFYSKDLIV
jgi:hypothetical protein